MMHKAWCNLEEVPYNFSRSSIKFQGHTGRKIDDLNPIWVRILGRSQLTNPSDLPCSSSYVKFQGHTAKKIVDFDPNWAFPDCNSSLNSPMAMKWCTKLVTPVWIHIWWWNDAYSLIMLRRGALLFFKVIRQISRSHGSKNRRIWPRLGVSGL